MPENLSRSTGTAAVFCELPESLLVTLAAGGQIKSQQINPEPCDSAATPITPSVH